MRTPGLSGPRKRYRHGSRKGGKSFGEKRKKEKATSRKPSPEGEVVWLQKGKKEKNEGGLQACKVLQITQWKTSPEIAHPTLGQNTGEAGLYSGIPKGKTRVKRGKTTENSFRLFSKKKRQALRVMGRKGEGRKGGYPHGSSEKMVVNGP